MEVVKFGDQVVFYEGADQNNEPMLAQVRVVACNGTVADLCVLPWGTGPVMYKKNVRHVDDPQYAEFPQQKRFGGFASYAEHQAHVDRRLEQKRKMEEARSARENAPEISPLKFVGDNGTESPEQMIERLHAAGRIPAFICEVVDELAWPLERVNEYIATLDGGKKEKPSRSKKEKEPVPA